MNQVVSITKSINSYEDVHQKFNLKRTEKEHFFVEWFENLPELTEAEKSTLDKIKQRYINHRAKGLLTESTVIILVIAPLLELAGFYDPPFMIKAEESLEIELENQEEILRGRIDVLVIKDKLWILIVEAKNTQLTAELAIPQCLAYMMGHSNIEKPIFGLVTNGGEFILLKLSKKETAEYDISRIFSLLPRQNELYNVLSFLKQIKN
ncbi:MAG: type I restriction endonuclease subunit R [Crocosphaera sp.]